LVEELAVQIGDGEAIEASPENGAAKLYRVIAGNV
jgi:hypothetical protein